MRSPTFAPPRPASSFPNCPLRFGLALAASLLLSACAGFQPASESSSAPFSQQGIDSRHASLRPATPAPDWTQLRAQLEAVASTEHGDILISALDDGHGLKLKIPVAEGFASGSSTIRASLAAALDSLAPALAAQPGLSIAIVGHTDSIGSEMFNLRLSIARAEAVQAHLAARGIALDHLSADGRGEAEPIVDNASETGRARNRRVELLLRAAR